MSQFVDYEKNREVRGDAGATGAAGVSRAAHPTGTAGRGTADRGGAGAKRLAGDGAAGTGVRGASVPGRAADVRRTAKTVLGQQGVAKDWRDRLHGHAMTDVSSKHYDRHDYLDEKRQAMAAWDRWLSSTLDSPAPK